MIHKTADVQTSKIGKDTYVWQHSVVLAGAAIGQKCNINAHCFIENKVNIGDNVTIKCGNYIWDGIHIANHVFIGPNVTFTNDMLPRSGNTDFELLETHLEDFCSIGGGATLLPGIRIGRYSMIGAGSLVTKDIPDFQLWYGSPAKHSGYITKEGRILDLSLVCKETGDHYMLNEDNEPIIT